MSDKKIKVKEIKYSWRRGEGERVWGMGWVRLRGVWGGAGDFIGFNYNLYRVLHWQEVRQNRMRRRELNGCTVYSLYSLYTEII